MIKTLAKAQQQERVNQSFPLSIRSFVRHQGYENFSCRKLFSTPAGQP